jgi:hypothetical protein
MNRVLCRGAFSTCLCVDQNFIALALAARPHRLPCRAATGAAQSAPCGSFYWPPSGAANRCATASPAFSQRQDAEQSCKLYIASAPRLFSPLHPEGKVLLTQAISPLKSSDRLRLQKPDLPRGRPPPHPEENHRGASRYLITSRLNLRSKRLSI